MIHGGVLKYLMERNRVDTLKVIATYNVARYVRNKADVEAMQIPRTVKYFLVGFVEDDEQAGAEELGPCLLQ